MANDSMSKSNNNETMQNEKANASVGGDNNAARRPNETGLNKDHGEKSAIGGGSTGETGEPGRARSELDQNQTTGKSGEFDKSRNETTGSR